MDYYIESLSDFEVIKPSIIVQTILKPWVHLLVNYTVKVQSRCIQSPTIFAL